MILSIFGFLVDPTDQFKSPEHRKFSVGFVWIITKIVGTVTPLALLTLPLLLISCLLLNFSIQNNWTKFALIWFAIETLFYMYCRLLARKFEPKTCFPGGRGIPREERSKVLLKYLEECEDPFGALARWFPSHKKDDIGVECMEEWISWAYLSKNLSDLSKEEKEEVNKLVKEIVKRCPEVGRKGKEMEFKFMRLHFDKLVYQHKPFVAYLVITIIQKTGCGFIFLLGFKHHSLPGNTPLTYWSYEPEVQKEEPKSNSPRPIFFVHGIGIGIVMYYNVIKTLVEKDPQRPIYILDLPHISLKIVNQVPTMEETLEGIDFIFKNHNLKDCSWLAHSYGSIVTAWVIKERGNYVSKLSMVDPVCFALWEPDLIYNFLYRKPAAPIHKLCQFFVAQDLLVSYTLFRNFWWSQNLLFPQDVNCKAFVYLSSHDFIIDCGKIKSYLAKRRSDREKFDIVEMEGLSHGSFLNSAEYLGKIVGQV